MNRETFIDAFVVAFLATWVANNYDNACARGEHSRLNNPPAEDALGLAEAAWKKVEASR